MLPFKKKLQLVSVVAITLLSGCGHDSDLKDRALNEIFESNYSPAGPGGLCDKVEEAKLADVRIGTISKTDITGEFPKPLPAIVARHDFVCVMSGFGIKKKDPDQWVILAIDKEFGVVRCLRTGPKSVIDSLIQSCGFRDSSEAKVADTVVDEPKHQAPPSVAPAAPAAPVTSGALKAFESKAGRFATVSIRGNSDTGFMAMYVNGTKMVSDMSGTTPSFAQEWQREGRDIYLIAVGSGGTACPAEYRFLTVERGKLTLSDEFGNCSDIPEVSEGAGEIVVKFPSNDGSVDTARYVNGDVFWKEASDQAEHAIALAKVTY